MTEFRDFKDTKRLALLAFYKVMMRGTAAEWLTVEDVTASVQNEIPIVYLRKALQSLLEERLLKTKRGAAGPQLFTIAEEGILVVEQRLSTPSITEATLAPASDRIVSRYDNSEIREVDDKIDELANVLASDNEVGSALGEERELLSADFAAASALTKQSRFRIERLMLLLMPALRFLADKFAAGAVGEAAKHLIALLMKAI